MCLVVCSVLFLATMRGAAVELEIGSRFPAEPKENIIVKNDGGVSNVTDSFGFGEACHADDHLKTWFVVLRIVGDQVLIGFECNPTVFGDACPNGTQTSMSLVQARSRLNAYVADSEKRFMEDLQRPLPRFTTPRE
jgi:hypothetical protein